MNPNGPVISQRHQHLGTMKKSTTDDPNVVISQRHRFNTLPAPISTPPPVRNVQPAQPVAQYRSTNLTPVAQQHQWVDRKTENQLSTRTPPIRQFKTILSRNQPPSTQPSVNLGYSIKKSSGTVVEPQQPTIISQSSVVIESLRSAFGNNTTEKKE